MKHLFWGVALLLISCETEEITTIGNLVPATVDQDGTLSSISINGTLLHAESYGNPQDPLLVFLHGGPGGDYRNALDVQQLAHQGYFVVFYDQRGSGLSQRHDKNSYSIQLMLDDLAGVIEHYRTSESQRVFLFGHSWGGMLAAAYINKYPSAISGAIFAEPGGLNKELLDEYSENSRKLKLFSETTNDVLYPGQFMSGKENDHEILDYNLAVSTSYSYAEGNSEGVEGPSPFWRLGAVVLESLSDIAEEDGFDFTTNLQQYDANVLFLYGELNTAYGLDFAQKEAGYFPSATIEKIEDTGHEMIYFQWEAVYREVLAYLNSIND